MVAKKRIILDFNTKFIPRDRKVWVIFPGEAYKFLSHFLSRGVVFADLPAFPVKGLNFENDDLLKSWIVVSQKVRAFHVDRKKEEPDRDPAKYVNYSWTGPRTNAKGVIQGLYSRAKRGDLVLVTSRGGAWGETHIGEFLDEPGDVISEQFERYPGENMPARRVNWRGSIENRVFDQGFVKLLTSPNGFSQASGSYHDLIFQRAYGNYVRTEMANSMFDIRAEDFSTLPDMYLKIIANFAAEVIKHRESGTIEEFLEKDFSEWLFNLEDSEYFPNQQININSPGKNLLHSITHSPILAVVIFALCQHPAADLKAAELEFKNSATGGQLDDCDIPVVEDAQTAFGLMSLGKLELLCRAANKAKELGKIETPIKTELIGK